MAPPSLLPWQAFMEVRGVQIIRAKIENQVKGRKRVNYKYSSKSQKKERQKYSKS